MLTHHVVPGRLTPDQLAGEHATVANDKLTVDGFRRRASPSPATRPSAASRRTVLCGNVQTANATVYIIDQVLKPPKPG